MQKFDGNKDGRVTFAEFCEAYEWISATIDSDDYFDEHDDYDDYDYDGNYGDD